MGPGGCQEHWDPATLPAPSPHWRSGAQAVEDSDVGRVCPFSEGCLAAAGEQTQEGEGQEQGQLPPHLDHGRVGALDGRRVEAREEGPVADGVALGEHKGLGAAVGQLWVQPPDLQWVVGKGSAPAGAASLGQRAELSWRPQLQADSPAPPGSRPSGAPAHHAPSLPRPTQRSPSQRHQAS